VGADQIGVVDPAIVDIPARGPLRLQLFDHVAFLNQVVSDFDAGDFFESLGQDLGFILVCRNGLGNDLDVHALEGLGRVDEPLHLFELLLLGQRGWLEFFIDPFFGCSHVRTGRRDNQR